MRRTVVGQFFQASRQNSLVLKRCSNPVLRMLTKPYTSYKDPVSSNGLQEIHRRIFTPSMFLQKYYRYCRAKVHDHPPTSGPAVKVPYGLIFRQTKMQLYNVFITFFVTLAVWPAVISGNLVY